MESDAIQQKAIEYGIHDNLQDIHPDTLDAGQIAYTQSGKIIQVMEWGTVTDKTADVRLLMWPSGNLDDVETYPTPDGKHCVEINLQIVLGTEKGWLFTDEGGNVADVSTGTEAAQPEATEAGREAVGVQETTVPDPVDIFTGEAAPLPENPYVLEEEDVDAPPAELNEVLEKMQPAVSGGRFYPPQSKCGGCNKVTVTLDLSTEQLSELLSLLQKWEGK